MHVPKNRCGARQDYILENVSALMAHIHVNTYIYMLAPSMNYYTIRHGYNQYLI